MVTTAQKAVALSHGAAVGGTTSAASYGVLRAAMSSLAKASPRAAAVTSRVASTVLAAPVVATGAAVGALYGGVKSYREGKRGAELTLKTIGGAASLGTNVIVDGVVAVTGAGKKIAPEKPALASSFTGDGSVLTPKQEQAAKIHTDTEAVRAELGRKIKDAEARMKREGATGQGAKWKQANEDRQNAINAIGALDQGRNEKLTNSLNGGPAATVAPATPKKGLVESVKEAVFGPPKAPVEDALTKERKQLEGRLKEQQEIARIEYSGRGGAGPKYDKMQADIKATQEAIGQITKRQEAREKEELATYRNIGAAIVGLGVGTVLGKMTERKARALAEESSKGVVKLARTAVQSVNATPKGVIAGTVQGDKAAAAVAAAQAANGKRVVSGVEVFGLPAINIAHGAAAVTYSAMKPDDPAAPLARMEGTAAIVAGVVGGKFALAAYNMRSRIPLDMASKLKAAQNRLTREGRTGAPAGVALAKGRQQAAVAGINAKGVAERAAITSAARTNAAQVGSQAHVVEAGIKVAVAKQVGAGKVEIAGIRAKGNASREITRQNATVAPYKNTWVDKNGIVKHRRDMSVRRSSGSGPANDNTGRKKVAG